MDIPAAGVFFFFFLKGGRIPLCLTCPKTLDTFVRMFFVLVLLFGGLFFLHGSEPPSGEGFLQRAVLIVFFSLLQCRFSSSTLLTTRSDTAFFLNVSRIEYLQL